jgi:hypothetical protein
MTSGLAYDTVCAVIDTNAKCANSARAYRSNLNTLLKLFRVDSRVVTELFDENSDSRILEKIETTYRNASNYLCTIVWLISNVEALRSHLAESRRDFYLRQYKLAKAHQTARSIEERKSFTDYEEVYASLFELERRLARERYGSIDHVLALMYSRGLYDDAGTIHMNPRNYFACVRLDYTPPPECIKHLTGNVLYMPQGRLVLTDYKTSNMYEPYDVVLSTYSMNVIRSSLEMFPRSHLLSPPKGGPYRASSLRDKLCRVVGHGVDKIRKSIESYEIMVKGSCRVHLAMVSRHSVATQDISYLDKSTKKS